MRGGGICRTAKRGKLFRWAEGESLRQIKIGRLWVCTLQTGHTTPEVLCRTGWTEIEALEMRTEITEIRSQGLQAQLFDQ